MAILEIIGMHMFHIITEVIFGLVSCRARPGETAPVRRLSCSGPVSSGLQPRAVVFWTGRCDSVDQPVAVVQ